MTRFRLRYQQHDFELKDGEFVIGRGTDCQLALDDALVSRRHAVIRAEGDTLTLEDLGSRNGVRLNGERLEGSAELHDGDKVRIGSQEMAIVRTHRVQAATLAQPAPTLRADAFGLLGALADKALAMGRGEEAERILSGHLGNVLSDVQGGRKITPDTSRQAATYALRLAAATEKGRWVDYVLDLYAALAVPCPAEVVDELYAVARKVKGADVSRLRAYVEILKGRALGPAERFLLNRIEGLEPLLALR